MPVPITFENVINHFGSRAKTARALGITKSSVTQWESRRGGNIPMFRQLHIQVLTRGKLRADTDPRNQKETLA